ncbi:hypothetical protein [Microvirga arsenatis]|uniref:Right handed beta helix domain-containing protein n=1 Tax=Microvirga arsenatis TaxID=2692265 RepID=A0ABW9YT66_9HYPH|nr:hypothetical protein [Microvirga arsenatis]NBJ11617.1 hypothetical protein [Microvirga arsenatis]NBJ22826.1 hypothetical protein [Microvirga arsenatis]
MATIFVKGPTGKAKQDTAAINNAIQKAYEAYLADPTKTPVKVQLAKGTYVVTGDKTNPSKGAIELPSGIELTGSGTRESIVKLENHFDARINGIVRTKLETVENVTVSNLIIDGNRANNTDHQAGFICGVKEDGSGRIQKNITIDGVEVRNCTAYGLNPHEVTYNMVIKNSTAHNNGLDGFVADAVRGGVYINNKAYNNDRHGFNIQNETKGLKLQDNLAYDNGYRYLYQGQLAGGAGLTIQRGNIPPVGSTIIPWVSDVEIIGGQYYNNGKEGILVKLSERILIKGAWIYGNERQGVRIEGSKDVTVDSSRVYNNSQEANGVYDEINIRLRFDDDYSQLTYYSLNTRITNNTIYADGAIRSRYGIREEPTNDDGGPTGTFLDANTIYGMVSGFVSVPGYLNPVVGTSGADNLVGTPDGDEMKGLGGDDTYTVNHTSDVVIEDAGAGTDHVFSSIKFILGPNVENLTLTGTAVINGTGNELANKLFGNGARNELKGLGGSDTLDGGGGDDELQGGDGNDTYYIDSTGDVVIEKENLGAGGVDTVNSTISYTLTQDVENLTLLGSANINATGNASANVLTGNSGANVLDGLAGADRMIGGAGDDTYFVNNTGDVVVENADEGLDRVVSTISHVLAQNVENLTLLGAALNGTGNALDNTILGNDQANKLTGADGNDTLDGGLGNDTLDGGIGTDTAVYAGNRADYAITGTLSDRTITGGTSGTDALRGIEILQFADGRLVGDTWEPTTPPDPGNPGGGSGGAQPGNQPAPAPSPIVSSRTGTNRSEILNGSGADNIIKGMGGHDVIRGFGGNDSLYGNSGHDRLNGHSGNDRVSGGAGNDSVDGGAGNDRVLGDSGNDRVAGSDGDDWVHGGTGSDTVGGGAGNDTVFGGSGNDTLYGRGGLDAFVFNARLGSASTDRAVSFDRIVDFSVAADSLWLDNAIFRKLGAGSLAAPAELNSEFFVIGSRARERDDYLIYNKTTGVLSYDADGSGARQAVEFAQLGKNLKLTFKDFLIV